MNWFPQPRFMFGSAFHEPPAKAGASSTHSKRCRAVAERLGLREAFGVRPACRRFPKFMLPIDAPKRKEAFHEPTHPRPLPGGGQTFVRCAKVPLLGGVRSGFMFPMHA